MLTMPRVQIVIPAYNAARWIRQSIQSVIDQTFTAWRLIVVDDGSTDATGRIASRMAEKDPRIVVIRQANGGTGSALNAGWKHGEEAAPTEYQTWWSADSWVEPNWLADLVTALDAHPDVGFVYGDFSVYVEATKTSTFYACPEFNWQRHQSHCEVGCCWLWRRKLKDAAGPWQTTICEDYAMWLKMADLGKFMHVPGLMGHWRQHDSNLSLGCNKDHWKDSCRIVTKHKWSRHADIKVAQLHPWLDCAGVGWWLAYGMTESPHRIAVRHILKEPWRLNQSNDLLIGKDDAEIRRTLDECDIIHLNCVPDFDLRPWLDKGKKLLYHLHGGPWINQTDIIQGFIRDYGAKIVSCEPAVTTLVPEGLWVPNPIPLDPSGRTKDSPLFDPLPGHLNDNSFRMHMYHNYSVGKGPDVFVQALDYIEKLFKVRLTADIVADSDKSIPIRDDLERKRRFSVCVDQITQGYIGMAGWISMAQGCAVIARLDEWAVAEYTKLGDGEMPPIVNVLGINQTIAAMLDLHRNPDKLQEIRRKSREWMVKYYSSERLLAYWANLYREVLAVPSPVPTAVCRFRKNNTCKLLREIVSNDKVDNATCQACQAAGSPSHTNPVVAQRVQDGLRKKPARRPATAKPPVVDPWQMQDYPCQFRGEKVREVICKVCGNRGAVAAVFACDIHGECTRNKTGNPLGPSQVCIGCPDSDSVIELQRSVPK